MHLGRIRAVRQLACAVALSHTMVINAASRVETSAFVHTWIRVHLRSFDYLGNISLFTFVFKAGWRWRWTSSREEVVNASKCFILTYRLEGIARDSNLVINFEMSLVIFTFWSIRMQPHLRLKDGRGILREGYLINDIMLKSANELSPSMISSG